MRTLVLICCLLFALPACGANRFIFEGDSITDGTLNSAGYRLWQYVTNLSSFAGSSQTNIAHSGDTLVYAINGLTTETFPNMTGTPYVWCMIGFNDLRDSNAFFATYTEATWYQTYTNFHFRVHTNGGFTIASTICGNPYEGGITMQTMRTNLNWRIRDGWTNGVFDYLVDSAALLPTFTDTNQYKDQIHPSDWGIMVIATNLNTALEDLPAGPTTYYVSTSGDNANPGTAASPWRNIYYAATNVGPGDTVIVTNGVYDELVTFTISGTSNLPITFRADGAVTNKGTFFVNLSVACH